MRHYSKKDRWLVVFVVAAILLPFAIAAVGLARGLPEFALQMLIAGIVTLGIVLLLTYPLFYEITPTELKVRCGLLINKRIPLSAIESIVPSRRRASAPTWSLDRLRVAYKIDGDEHEILISPKERTRFLQELVNSSNSLVISGDGVRRKV